MRLKRTTVAVCMLMLLVSGVSAQGTGSSNASQWQRYTVKGEQFSVDLPAAPTVDYRRTPADSRGERIEISLGSFSDGVLYLIQVFENLSPRQSLNSFIKDRANSGRPWNRKTERKFTLEGVAGKTFSFSGIDGAVQFFSKGDRLFQFTAIGAPEADERLTRFFSSISLVNNKNGIEVSENLSLPLLTDPPSSSDEPEHVFTPKEVDKEFQMVMNFHPEYTEAARQNRIEGTIILQCTLAADGYVRNIRVVSGLPYGLSERAIAAARKLKFIPAMKQGKYVSVSTRLVYRFDLF